MTEAVLTCPVHPDRETTLRCNRCNRPICHTCAVQTPVGYRCKECVRGHQRVFDTAVRRDYLLASVISGVGMGLGVGLLRFLGVFGLLLAPVLGGGLAEIVQRGISRRRSRQLPVVAAVSAGVGAAPYLAGPLLIAISALDEGGLPALIGLVWPVLVAGLAISSMYYRLRGIRIG
jgi:hypothetical protein